MTDAKNRLLRLPEVMELVGLSKPSVYRLMKTGDFPKAKKISARAVRWIKCEIDDWISSKVSA